MRYIEGMTTQTKGETTMENIETVDFNVRQVPDVHANDRQIPPGKVLLRECRDMLPSDPRVKIESLDNRTAWGSIRVSLVARQAGWAIAGSCMRWDNGAFGVLWEARDGARHGRWFRTYSEARTAFEKLPK